MTTKPTKKKPAMGSNPFDLLTSPTVAERKTPSKPSPPSPPSPAAKVKAKTKAPVEELADEAADGEKVRATFHLPEALLDRARDACYWTPGLTLARLAEDALAAELDRMEKKRGSAFPRRAGPLKAGRPIKG